MRRFNRSVLIIGCGLGLSAHCAAQTLFDNGGMTTTPTGACIPANNTSSQLQVVAGIPNGLIGVGHMLSGSNNNRIADDFTISDPGGWSITTIDVFDYQTLAPTTASPIIAMNVRIWRGLPGAPTSQIVFGDTTTNRLTASSFASLYRIGSACDLKRGVFSSTLSINTTLPPGTYWLDWQASGSAMYSGPWSPVVTINGLRSKIGANAVQSLDSGATWDPVIDNGPSPDFSSPDAPQDFPFVIQGTINIACYANCDGSTAQPALNANDFNCFLNKYAAGDSTANCDGSTADPILNANDFNCFLNAYAAGCT